MMSTDPQNGTDALSYLPSNAQKQKETNCPWFSSVKHSQHRLRGFLPPRILSIQSLATLKLHAQLKTYFQGCDTGRKQCKQCILSGKAAT